MATLLAPTVGQTVGQTDRQAVNNGNTVGAGVFGDGGH